MPSRQEAIADFYARKADELRVAVSGAVRGPDAMIEDACSVAWCQLLRNPQVELDHHGFGWLYVVAIREGYRLGEHLRRQQPSGDLAESVASDEHDDPDARLKHLSQVA